MWSVLVLLYALSKGARDLMKKKAMEKSSPGEVLVLYTLISFCLVLPEVLSAFSADTRYILLAAVKALLIFVAFLCSFHAIRQLPISLYGVVEMSGMLFSLLLGVLFLHEAFGIWQFLGAILVGGGILLLKVPDRRGIPGNSTPVRRVFVILAFTHSFLNACSGTMDKVIMRHMTSGQLQFWFLLFLALFYLLYALFTRLSIRWSRTLKNPWIWIISLVFVFADRLLFLANGMTESQVVIMTLLKRSSCLVTILGGWLFFRERHIAYKLMCALVVLAGIAIAALLPA